MNSDRPFDVLVQVDEPDAAQEIGLRQGSNQLSAERRQFDLFGVVIVSVVLVENKAALVRGRPLVGRNDLLAGFVSKRTNNERRTRLVDQNAVRLVDEGEMGATLHWLLAAAVKAMLARLPQNVISPLSHPSQQQAIAEEIEAKFFRRPVGDVARIGLAALIGFVRGLNDSDRHSQRFVQRPHPLGVTRGQVIVDRGEVSPFADERMKVEGKGRSERFSFARLHFGEAPVEHCHPADVLDVEVAHVERPPTGFPYECECFGQKRRQRFTAFRTEL